MQLLIATSNPGKLREYRILLAGAPVEILSLHDVGLGAMDVVETGKTFEANARLKAEAYAQASGMTALTDDTGLVVDALNGAPGVYSARYGGAALTMADRRAKILAELDGLPDDERTARFVCVIALTTPNGETFTVEGVCDGRIAREDRGGASGFGYDAIFIPDGFDVTWSQVSLDDKNRVSHRGAAARAILPILTRLAAES